MTTTPDLQMRLPLTRLSRGRYVKCVTRLSLSGADHRRMETTRECTKCREVRPLTEYHRSPSGRDGRRSICRYCMKAYRERRRADDPEGMRAMARRNSEDIRRRRGVKPRTRAGYVERDMGYRTSCWLWTGGMHKDGYGAIGRQLAHRVFYERHVGPIPADRELDHLCRNRACVNPAHLDVVTDAENTRRGLSTKITLDIARAIRASSETQVALAQRYGLGTSQIGRIRRGESWREDDARDLLRERRGA